MPIGNAVQRGAFVYVYDQRGRQIGTLSAGNRPPDGLHGFTAANVSIRRGAFIYTYDDRCRHVSTVNAG